MPYFLLQMLSIFLFILFKMKEFQCFNKTEQIFSFFFKSLIYCLPLTSLNCITHWKLLLDD